MVRPVLHKLGLEKLPILETQYRPSYVGMVRFYGNGRPFRPYQMKWLQFCTGSVFCVQQQSHWGSTFRVSKVNRKSNISSSLHVALSLDAVMIQWHKPVSCSLPDVLGPPPSLGLQGLVCDKARVLHKDKIDRLL
jgi:hypothetical protein